MADEQNDAPTVVAGDLYILCVNTDTLRHLVDATEALKRAVVASSCGAVEDHCQTAMQAIRQAMRSAGA